MAGAREERRQRSQLCRSSGLSGGPELEWRLEMGWRQRLSHGRHRHHQPPAFFVPATTTPEHMTQRRGGEAGVLGGAAWWRYCITAGLHMRRGAECKHGELPGNMGTARGGAVRCGAAAARRHPRHTIATTTLLLATAATGSWHLGHVVQLATTQTAE